MRKSKIIRGEDIKWELGQEPPLQVKRAVSAKTVDSPRLEVKRVIIPPGARNQPHYHVNCDAVMFLLKGRLKFFIGPDHQMEKMMAQEGDYVFVPAGAIHGLVNPCDTEPVEVLATKNVSLEEEEGTMFVGNHELQMAFKLFSAKVAGPLFKKRLSIPQSKSCNPLKSSDD